VIELSRIIKSWNTYIDENNVFTVDNTIETFPVEDEEQVKEVYEEPIINLEEIKQKANQIIEDAQNKALEDAKLVLVNANERAKKIIDTAIEEANAKVGEIEESARNKGYNEGIESAKSEAEVIVLDAENIKKEAHIYKEELIKGVEPEIIDMIVSTLDSLIGIEKDINKNVMSIIVKNAINKTGYVDNITVHISEEDYDNIDKDAVLSSLENRADVTFSKDVTLKKTDCIIETPLGNIDCSLDTQYTNLRRNLYYVLKNR